MQSLHLIMFFTLYCFLCRCQVSPIHVTLCCVHVSPLCCIIYKTNMVHRESPEMGFDIRLPYASESCPQHNGEKDLCGG